jgi:hypothetical protein
LYAVISSIVLFVTAKFLFKVPLVNGGIVFLMCALSYLVFLSMGIPILRTIYLRTVYINFSASSLKFFILLYPLMADLTVALWGKTVWKCSWKQAFLSVGPMTFFHLLFWFCMVFVGAG